MNVYIKRESGAFCDKSRVTYLLSLPVFQCDCQVSILTNQIKEAFLSFLQKESQKVWDKTRFGGLRFERREDGFLIESAYSPFSERVYFPRAYLKTDPEGELLEIVLFKKASLPSKEG